MLGAIEVHVFNKVSHPLLIVIFKNGTGIHSQPQFHLFLGLRIRLDIVSHAIGQRSCFNIGIEGKRALEALSSH